MKTTPHVKEGLVTTLAPSSVKPFFYRRNEKEVIK
jgi:hypothetical protein